MEITLKNAELAPAVNFLQSMELKAADSRHRSKLINLILEAHKGLQEAEKHLTEEYGKRDDSGALVKADDGINVVLDPAKAEEYQEENKKLLQEEVIIKGGMYARNIEKLPEILNRYDGVLSGVNAEIYDRLLDELEELEEGVAE